MRCWDGRRCRVWGASGLLAYYINRPPALSSFATHHTLPCRGVTTGLRLHWWLGQLRWCLVAVLCCHSGVVVCCGPKLVASGCVHRVQPSLVQVHKEDDVCTPTHPHSESRGVSIMVYGDKEHTERTISEAADPMHRWHVHHKREDVVDEGVQALIHHGSPGHVGDAFQLVVDVQLRRHQHKACS